MSGWFAVKRGMTDHPAMGGDWRRIGWFLWLIENACYAPTEINIAGKPFIVPRGALCFSERFIADKFGISQKALRTFLDTLERHGVIVQGVAKVGQGTKSKRKQITLCNYEKYQDAEIKTKSKRNQNGSKEEQVNNIPVGDADKSAPDLATIIFRDGLRVLVGSGVKESHARSLLGKWRKESGDADLIAAIGKAQREGAIDPKAFIGGCLRQEAKREAPVGYVDAGAFGMIPERN